MRRAHAEPLELVDDLLEVAPCVALAIRRAEEKGRVKCRHHSYAAKLVKAPAQRADGCAGLEQRLRRRTAERDNEARRDGLDLSVEERQALGHLVRLWIAIARRAAFEHVGDVDGVARPPHRLDHAVEELAGGADERLAAAVL